jgi:hypothetical protein
MIPQCEDSSAYVADHSSAVTASLRVLPSALPRCFCRIRLPVTEDTRLCDDTLSIACRFGDKALQDDGTISNVLPVLLRGCAEVDNVCAREVLAKEGQQLIL